MLSNCKQSFKHLQTLMLVWMKQTQNGWRLETSIWKKTKNNPTKFYWLDLVFESSSVSERYEQNSGNKYPQNIQYFTFANINSFVPSVPFLYPLKTSESRIFWCFKGAEKRCIGNEWVNTCKNFLFQNIDNLYTCNVKFNKNNMRFGNWQIGFIHSGHFLP